MELSITLKLALLLGALWGVASNSRAKNYPAAIWAMVAAVAAVNLIVLRIAA